jgi:hypothetical protein
MKASELIEKLEKAIAKVGDVDIKGVKTDDYCGGVEHLYSFNHLCITDKGNIIISEFSNYDDCYYKFEEIK